MGYLNSDFLDDLRNANTRRCPEFHAGIGVEIWGPMQWGCALAGEAGELCNELKKLERDGDTPERKRKIEDEMADVLCYLDLTAARLGIDLESITRRKFNAVSDRIGSKVRL